jgi:hypothetical protein
MNIVKTVNAKSLFAKTNSNVFVVPSKYQEDELLKIFQDYFSGYKSLDYEFRNKIKESMNEQVVSSTVYQVYYSANANYEIEIKAKCRSGSNIDIIKNTFSKLISDNYPTLEKKEEAVYDEGKKLITIRLTNGVLKNYFDDPSIKEIVEVNEQANNLESIDVNELSIDVFGLILNNRDLTKKIDKDLNVYNKKLIKECFKSYDFRITSIKIKNVKITQNNYTLIPYTRYYLDNKYYSVVNNVSGKVYIDTNNMPVSSDVKFRLLELSNYDKFNAKMLFAFYMVLIGAILFYPLMQVDQFLNTNINIFIGLGVSYVIGAIIGLIRAIKYSLSHKVTIEMLAGYFDSGEYEVVKNKRKDKKVMMLTGVIIALVIAVILIVVTFMTFNK